MSPSDGQVLVITGGGGFIGASLTRELLAQRACDQVIRTLIGPTGAPVPEWFAATDTRAEVRFGDIADHEIIDELVRGADAVIHLAGPPSVARSFDNPVGTVHAHVTGTTNVAHACVRHGVRRLVYVSSAEVYGSSALGAQVMPDAPLNPRSPYGAAKVAAEAVLRTVVEGSTTSAIVLRPFSVYGPGQSSDSLLGSIQRQLKSDTGIRVFDLAPVRDYVYIDDVVAALLTAASSEYCQPDPMIVDIGTGTGTSVQDLCVAAASVAGRSVSITELSKNDRPARATVASLVADPEPAARLLGWRASISLRDGLRVVLR